MTGSPPCIESDGALERALKKADEANERWAMVAKLSSDAHRRLDASGIPRWTEDGDIMELADRIDALAAGTEALHRAVRSWAGAPASGQTGGRDAD